jgi:type I restriction enzyme M protein
MKTKQLKQLEEDRWSAADNLRTVSDLTSREYAAPMPGLIFLEFADNRCRGTEPGQLQTIRRDNGCISNLKRRHHL